MTTFNKQTATTTELTARGFREFTNYDWQAFAGCESDHPQLWDDSEQLCVVLDGEQVNAIYRPTSGTGEYFGLIYNGAFGTPTAAATIAIELVNRHIEMPAAEFDRHIETLMGESVGLA